MEQQQRSFGLGVGAGIAAGIAGAAVWAIVTGAINARIGYLALGVGAGVGFVVGRLGKGPDNGPLPIIAAVIALVSVAAGDTIGWAGELSHDLKDAFGVDIGTVDLVKGLITGSLDYRGEAVPVRQLYRDDVDFFVLLMVAVGVFAAYSLCRRQLAEAAAPIAPQPVGYDAPTGPPATPTWGEPPASDGPIDFQKRP